MNPIYQPRLKGIYDPSIMSHLNTTKNIFVGQLMIYIVQ